jgi:hypothetical protein
MRDLVETFANLLAWQWPTLAMDSLLHAAYLQAILTSDS